ncbi:MAG: hypothetical protein KBA31_11490 [Alphaproteobacteria bacterium]|nr:hypothetical protein [Alphaproteobacteria bacterium]
MTVAATPERLERTLAYLRQRAAQRMCAPSNDMIAKVVGMGAQRFQPWGRMRGWRCKSHEAGAVLIFELERQGKIKVTRGRNWRIIEIVETGQVLDRRTPDLPAWAA